MTEKGRHTNDLLPEVKIHSLKVHVNTMCWWLQRAGLGRWRWWGSVYTGMEEGCVDANLSCYLELWLVLFPFLSLSSFLPSLPFFPPSLSSFLRWINKTISCKFHNERWISVKLERSGQIGTCMI